MSSASHFYILYTLQYTFFLLLNSTEVYSHSTDMQQQVPKEQPSEIRPLPRKDCPSSVLLLPEFLISIFPPRLLCDRKSAPRKRTHRRAYFDSEAYLRSGLFSFHLFLNRFPETTYADAMTRQLRIVYFIYLIIL